MKFAYSMGFWLWRIEWCDRHLCHVTGSDHITKCQHSRVVGLRLEDNLVAISVRTVNWEHSVLK